MQISRWSEAALKPWKNGAGTARLLAASSDDDAFDWRVTVADVLRSGGFSRFPGVERTITLLDGPAMRLTFGSESRDLIRYQPLVFDGDLDASSDVSLGPTRVLNLMTRRGRCHALVKVIDSLPHTVQPTPGATAEMLVPLAGPLSVRTAGSPPILLHKFDLLELSGATVELEGVGPVAWARVCPE